MAGRLVELPGFVLLQVCSVVILYLVTMDVVYANFVSYKSNLLTLYYGTLTLYILCACAVTAVRWATVGLD